MKLVIILCILIFNVGALCTLNIRALTYFTIISVFFPIHITLFGKDAITTGSISIFLLYLRYLNGCYWERNFIKEKYDLLVYFLIILGAISVIFPYLTGVLGNAQFDPAIRRFFNFFGALLLFVIIKNYREDNFEYNSESYTNHIEKLLSLFLILISIHVLLSIVVKYIPSFAYAFKPFLTRDIIAFDIYGRDELERIRSFVFSYEAYGEILAALSPLVLYKIFRFRKTFWFICLLLFSIGVIFSVTRSGIILFIIGISASLMYYFWKKRGKVLILTSVFLTTVAVVVYLNLSVFSDVLTRFSDASETFSSDGTLFQIINRDGVFIPAWDLVSSNLSFFGNGISEFYFHSLFLTTLHEKGVFGATLFFVVLVYPAIRLMIYLNHDMNANRALIFSCFLSMALFMINEVKFEFTRHASYQQICWAVLGTYYLVSKTPFNREER